MDGWMDGWMDRWMDEWVDGWMNGWTDRQMDGGYCMHIVMCTCYLGNS